MSIRVPPAHDARLRRLRIRNFRGIESLEIEFEGTDQKASPIMVLTGPNGCGKTAVLEACLIVAGQSELAYGRVGKDAAKQGAEDYEIVGLFDTSSGQHEVTKTGREHNGSSWCAHVEYFASWRAPKLVGSVSVTSGKRGKRPARNQENRLWIIKQFLVNARAHRLMGGQKGADGRADYENVIAQVNNLWKRFYPSSKAHFVVEPTADDPNEGFDVFLNQAQGRLSVDELSSGQIELFCLAGSMMDDYNHGGLVLIDEPELHLDHAWHRLVLREMRALRPRSQFIVATHSPEVSESVASHERRALLPGSDPRLALQQKASGTGVKP